MWGRPKIVAISVTLILVSIGIYFSPAFAGGSPCEFAGFDICFDGEIDDSWVGAPVDVTTSKPTTIISAGKLLFRSPSTVKVDPGSTRIVPIDCAKWFKVAPSMIVRVLPETSVKVAP